MTTENCPTCGSTLHVQTSDEGTSFFIPVDVLAIDDLTEKLANAMYESRRLRSLLEFLKEKRSGHTEAK